jgi:hypothetical protein
LVTVAFGIHASTPKRAAVGCLGTYSDQTSRRIGMPTKTFSIIQNSVGTIQTPKISTFPYIIVSAGVNHAGGGIGKLYRYHCQTAVVALFLHLFHRLLSGVLIILIC